MLNIFQFDFLFVLQRGFIDRDEFAQLCGTFHIGRDDAETIFLDLDGDADGRISLDDFTRGFRDFLTPAVAVIKEPTGGGGGGGNKRPLRRQPSAQKAWLLFSDRIGHHNIRHFLSNSADRLYGIYEELHSRSTTGAGVPAQLVAEFDGLMESLVSDARQLELERQRFEEVIQREREQHRRHLKSLEEELEAQVQRVAAAVKQDTVAKCEAEKRDLQLNMETEIAQLQAHLNLFKKVETWLSKEQLAGGQPDTGAVIERTCTENRQLKTSLMEAQTTLALLQTELAQLKSHYSERDRLLHWSVSLVRLAQSFLFVKLVFTFSSEKEALVDLVNHQEHVQRQLELLQ